MYENISEDNILNVLLKLNIIDNKQYQNLLKKLNETLKDPLELLFDLYKLDSKYVLSVLKSYNNNLLFLNFLFENNIISKVDFENIKKDIKNIKSIEKELLKFGYLTEEKLADALAKYLNIKFIDNVKINFNKIEKFLNLNEKYKCFEDEEIILYDILEDDTLLIGISDIFSYNKAKFLVESNNLKAKYFIITYSYFKILNETIKKHKNKNLNDILLKTSLELNKKDYLKEQEINVELKELKREELEDEKRPIVRFLNTIIYSAVTKLASDIHFEIYNKKGKVKFRIDGVLIEVINDIPAEDFFSLISRIKILANLDIAEHRTPQDGRFEQVIESKSIDFRVSILPSIHGETAVIRILNRQLIGMNLNELGLDDEDYKKFLRAIFKPYGMILVSGPTGSGKTTTLYSAIMAIAKSSDKIITIEDPVEYHIDNVVQIPVNEKKGLTFSKGLRAIVRQDPDKIMVGEIRDPETAQIAVNAALTGHTVFSTIHANNVIDCISRLLNFKIEPYQFASSFNLIAAQRLVRKLCPFCKEVDNSEYVKQFAEFKNLKIYKPVGCQQCDNIGYKGRTAIFEILELDDEIRELIIENKSPLLIKQKAIEKGMKLLRQAAIEKVKNQITSIDEINRVTFE